MAHLMARCCTALICVTAVRIVNPDCQGRDVAVAVNVTESDAAPVPFALMHSRICVRILVDRHTIYGGLTLAGNWVVGIDVRIVLPVCLVPLVDHGPDRPSRTSVIFEIYVDSRATLLVPSLRPSLDFTEPLPPRASRTASCTNFPYLAWFSWAHPDAGRALSFPQMCHQASHRPCRTLALASLVP